MKRNTLICLTAMLVALTASAGEIAIGAKAPGFSLINAVNGRYARFEPGNGTISVVVFTCNQCPYAKAFEPRLIEIAKTYSGKGIEFFAVNPNDESKYPEEAIGVMKERAVSQGYPYPYLKDTDSSVARAYGARVTPHVFVVDGKGRVRYRGYVDDSAKPHEREHSGLSDALDSLLEGREIAATATKAFGCTIKWKSAR